ncbi:acyl-CoA thioesterase [Oceanidesulfovibrio indonesiensis]|nr:acyl-CoA thioesterase [Oceanidesulfovibrio indonesiensis]
MEGKPPSASRITMTHLVLPQDANPLGHGHGGVILKHIDTAAGMVAMRHVRGNAVTASIDRVDFIRPVFVGELVHLKANLNGVGKTSMEVGVRVEAENLTTGEVRYTNSAYLTFVALTVDGKPSEVPPLIPETEEDVRRQHEAAERRRMRLAMRCREGQ